MLKGVILYQKNEKSHQNNGKRGKKDIIFAADRFIPK